MKKIATLALIAAAALTSCNGDKLRDAEAQNEQLKGDLRETLATQDSLLVLVNDISDGMSQIKDLEKIISTPGTLGGESSSRKEQIRNEMCIRDSYPAGPAGASRTSRRAGKETQRQRRRERHPQTHHFQSQGPDSRAVNRDSHSHQPARICQYKD